MYVGARRAESFIVLNLAPLTTYTYRLYLVPIRPERPIETGIA